MPDFAAAARGMVAQVAVGKAIAQKGGFTVARSGRSMLKVLSLFLQVQEADFSKWWVLFADKRSMPHSSNDSTYTGAKEPFLDVVDLPSAQVLGIKDGLSAEKAATNYEGLKLDIPTYVLPRENAGMQVIDCISSKVMGLQARSKVDDVP
jgi:6-phosphogluconolactonase/glucosamine-6-phosphate isomerase/deaminase